ncbi:MAG: hypothetical protein IEMM0006_0322 [bacterium]|nr:MAG: hypothetical protein IEMM0006_0322 [bacterium]
MNQDKASKENSRISEKQNTPGKPAVASPKDYKMLYEQEVARNKAIYLSLFRNQKNIMIIIDASTMRIVDANQAAVGFYGYPYEILTKMYAYQITTLPKEELAKRLRQASNQEQTPDFGQHKLANNDIRDVEVRNGNINYEGQELLFIIVYDITERTKAQKALEKSEEKFRKIFKTSPDSVTISRIEDGKFLEINEGFTAISGYTQQEAIGKTAFEIGVWVDKEERKQVVEILKKKGVVKNFAARFRMKNGKIFHGLMSANIINIGGIPHILSVTRNVEEYIKSQKSLRQSEIKFRKAFKISPDSININRMGDGMYMETNDGFTAITGYTQEDVTGKTSLEIDIWADKEKRDELVEILKEKGSVHNFPARFRKKNGNIVHGLMSANIIDINGEPHILSVTRNVEEYIKAHEALQHSEQRYRTLFHLSPAGILLLDEAGTILDANPTYCKNIGYTAQEMVGEKIWKVVNNPLQEKKEHILNYIPTIPESKIAEKEVVNIRKNGEILFLHLYETRILLENNKPAILSISMNVTKEKQIREELARQAERLKEAQEIGRIGSWEMNWQTRELYWSDEMYRLLELGPSQNLDYDYFRKVIHPEDLKTAREVLKESVRNGTSFKYIHRLLFKDGRIKWVIERGKSFYNKNGKVIRTHGTVQDITQLKETEDKLKELNESLEKKVLDRTAKLKKKQLDMAGLLKDMQKVQQELRHSNHALRNLNHELEAFSYSVSHDLKAPLRAIRGFTTIMKEDYFSTLDENEQVLINDILSETDSMSEIIDALLQLSRTGRKNLNFVEFDLKPLAQSIFSEQQKEHNLPHARFKVHKLPPVFADYTLIKQLMANLLSNALKYSSHQPLPLVEIGYRKDSEAKETVFYVKDNGVGFDEGSAGKIFDAFRRLHSKKEFEGTGIGLAIAKRIVSRHRGRIWAKSKKGEGTTFFFTLSESNESI